MSLQELIIIFMLVVGGAVAWCFGGSRLTQGARLHRKNWAAARHIQTLLQEKPWRPGGALNYLRKLDPFVFEELLLLAFKKRGYRIGKNKRYSGDGGVDGRVYAKDGCYLVQAKRYSSAINPAHVADFAKVIEKEKACGGFFIHTGRTGAKAYRNKQHNITFISGEKLLQLLSVTLKNTDDEDNE